MVHNNFLFFRDLTHLGDVFLRYLIYIADIPVFLCIRLMPNCGIKELFNFTRTTVINDLKEVAIHGI